MTENMKKFLEVLSSDKEKLEKVKAMQMKEEIIAFAKESDVTLTPEDFVNEDGAELSEDELSAVAGGGGFCLLIGATDRGCGCLFYGTSFDDSVCIVLGVDGSTDCGSSSQAGYF